MKFQTLMEMLSSVSLLFPVAAIVFLRLGSYKTFPALLLYYAQLFLYSMLSNGLFDLPVGTIYLWGLCNNLLDVPLMLTFLLYLSPSRLFTVRILWTILSFVLFEVGVVTVMGMNRGAVTVIMAPGMILMVGLYFYFFIRQTRITVVQQRGAGRSIMAASLLFAYICYSVLYLLFYVVKTPYIADTLLLYYLTTFLSSVVLTAGIWKERIRIRLLHELRITRKELSAFYGEDAKVFSFRTTALPDLDGSAWN
ncbi:MAG: hypothetical protein RJA57_2003 [Bacteroidota bacterium]|jgi:hypothetical protein